MAKGKLWHIFNSDNWVKSHFEDEVATWYEYYKIFQNLECLYKIRDGLKAAGLITVYSTSGKDNSSNRAQSVVHHLFAVRQRIKELEQQDASQQ